MAYDEKEIDEAVLALLYVSSFEDRGARCAWKTYDWDITGKLFELGLIDDPRNKNKSVVLTPEGVARGKVACEKLFGGAATPKRGGVHKA